MAGPDREFWQQRFESGQTGWDRGGPHPQLAAWLEEGVLPKGARIAVPGCGRGHELAVLARAGLDVTGLDYTPAAVDIARAKLKEEQLPGRVEQADVLAWRPDQPLDLVYEQTCLCALHPDQWTTYAEQLQRWLKPGGRLLALFMQARREESEQGQVIGPPYHCDINAMRALFPLSLWKWPAPPYAQRPHERGWFELAVVLERR
ncbi:methyltransferase domain-containing protein [Roseateles sp.]|jgi:SAM-dependent methyltransferase|uniref:methyltransferase domain-containing protein n=1 Tax=Roseateles sp. TaxID=1971397 RepID=UPI0031D60A5A